MSLKLKKQSALILVALAINACSAGQDADEYVRDFGFRPLEIYQFNQGTSDIIAFDFNQDGLDDIIFINNHASRVEILLRKPDNGPGSTETLPMIEDRFENIGIVSDQNVTAFCIADFDGSGRPDLLTAGRQLGLFLRRQTEAGRLAPPEKIYLRDITQLQTVISDDLNNNDMPDILVAHRDRIEILWNDVADPFRSRSEIRLSGGDCSGIDVRDINGDGNKDILVYMGSDAFPFRVYLGDGSGGFGAENMVRHPPSRTTGKLAFPGDNRVLIGSILPKGSIFRLSELTAEPVVSFMDKNEVLPLRISLDGIARRSVATWTVVDMQNNGYRDLCVAAPELSQIHFFKTSPSGIAATPLKIDSLSGITSLTTTFEGNVIAYSPAEKSAALHLIKELDRFPAILPTPDDVSLVFANPNDNEYFCLIRHDRQKNFSIEARSLPDGAAIRKIDGEMAIGDPPEAVKAFSINPEQVGLLFFPPHRPPRMFVITSNEVLETASSSFRALNHTLPHSAFSIFNNNGNAEISVAQGNNARTYRLANGTWEPFAQYTPDTETARIEACVYNLPANGADNPGIFIYDSTGGEIISSEVGTTTVQRTHIPLRLGDFQGMELLGNPLKREIILAMIAGNNLYILRDNAQQFMTNPVAEYTSPSEKASLRSFEIVFTGPDKRPFLALVDTNNRSLELVELLTDTLKERLVFEVFNDSGFSRRPAGDAHEPRAVVSGDFNGNGIGDIAVLVHDKLIIYPGE